jgi:hypothetical protein
MESLFKDFAAKWVDTVNATVIEKAKEKAYLFKQMLRLVYSTDMTFSSISGTNANVTADVVTMDSELPLKSRGSIHSASGEIPKIGMGKYLGEKQLKEIQTLQALQKSESVIAAKIFDDYKACFEGGLERLEYMFHQALSNGVIEVGQDTNTGRAIRVDFGIPEANKFGVTKKWSEANAPIVDDLERVLDEAANAGVNLQFMLMDNITFNYFKKNTQVREHYAAFMDISGNVLPIPNLAKVNEMLAGNYNGLQIQVINRTFKVEKDNEIKTVRGWVSGAVSFYTSLSQVGDLVYSDLAEKEAPVDGVIYSYPEPYLMLTKSREGRPLREFTESSGIVLPVLQNVDEIYHLDTTELQVIDAAEVEGDATIILWTVTLQKADVKAGMATIGKPVADDVTDADLIEAVNKLSNAKEKELKGILGVS